MFRPILKKYNTLRNQILAIYLLVLLIVLSTVGILVFNQLGTMMRVNSEREIQQTAEEANGRMETLYNQIDTLTNQVATNSTIQQLLFETKQKKDLSLSQSGSLIQVINHFLAYSDAVSSMDLYTNNGERIYPFDYLDLTEKIDAKWIKQADQEKGRLVWIGKDPNDREYSYAIRKVTLMDHSFSSGGYLLVRVYNPYFEVSDISMNPTRGYMILFDQDNTPITTNYYGSTKDILKENTKHVLINKINYLMVKKKSTITGWTLVILTPMSFFMEGVSVVRNAILISGTIGFIIFLVFSVFLSAIITKPIIKLTNTMKKAKTDELITSPPMLSTKEIIELNDTYNRMVGNTNYLIQQVYEKELLHSQAELKTLQAQINPHFLYNTLNALYWSLVDKGEEELANLVIAMSDLYRYTIDKTDNNDVTIQDELEHIERYLQLMKMRMGDRLFWELSAPDDCLDTKIPKLTIQPLVENAILHGIENRRKQGSVFITVKKANDSSNWMITVRDNGMGMSRETLDSIRASIESEGVAFSKGMGMALVNVNKRLRLFYNSQDKNILKVKSDLGKGTEVTFEIPSKGV